MKNGCGNILIKMVVDNILINNCRENILIKWSWKYLNRMVVENILITRMYLSIGGVRGPRPPPLFWKLHLEQLFVLQVDVCRNPILEITFGAAIRAPNGRVPEPHFGLCIWSSYSCSKWTCAETSFRICIWSSYSCSKWSCAEVFRKHFRDFVIPTNRGVRPPPPLFLEMTPPILRYIGSLDSALEKWSWKIP